MPIEKKILAGLFLCSSEANEILQKLKPEWNEKVMLSLKEKLFIIHYSLFIQDIFPWRNELSEGINYEKFCESFLTQPDLFLRLRPEQDNKVKQKLQKAGVNFKSISDSCLVFDNATKLDSLIELDKEAVIQDYNSQNTGSLIKSEILNLPAGRQGLKSEIKIWDCCAGSGGKSIMLHDIYPEIQLTVSDKRETILSNLRKRFEKAGIKNYKRVAADLTSNQLSVTGDYDLILADVPCTGSGTWSRTPEQLYFFNPQKIDEYATLQKKIISKVIPSLKDGGYLIYITCSVFTKENEEVVAFIKKELKLELLKMKLLEGYEQKADSMFIAIFKKPLEN